MEYFPKRRKLEQPTTSSKTLNFSNSFLPTENIVNNNGVVTSLAPGSRHLSQQYIEWQLTRNSEKKQQPNHVLLFTIFNPLYPITCNLLHTICFPIATVLRIIIFKKNGIQAMIEFESQQDANSIKEKLHGCDIYSGCCTIKIDYARTKRLNVIKNNNSSWDHSKEFKEEKTHQVFQLKAPTRRYLLEAPRPRTPSEIRISNCDLVSKLPQIYVSDVSGTLPINLNKSNDNAEARDYILTNEPRHGSVCIVYGLDMSKINASRLFNLFCLYGNVIRIKFLKTKEGCAMVQMNNSLAVERAISVLRDITIFGSKIQINHSKQFTLKDVHIPFTLADGTLSFQDFSASPLNRFLTPDATSKNRLQIPSNTLHFFNTPPGIDSTDISNSFIEQNNIGLTPPTSIKFFHSKTERSSSGLMEFDTLDHAIEALLICNHQPVRSPSSKHPYIMKLCFSSSSSS